MVTVPFLSPVDKNTRSPYLRCQYKDAHGGTLFTGPNALIPQLDKPHGNSGFTLLEVATSLFILAILSALLVPLATSIIDGERASTADSDMAKIYTAIVGNPAQNTYGYLGDVGCYPASLLDLVQQPASVSTGCTLAAWNGPYLSDVRIDNSMIYDSFGGPIEYFQTYPVAFPTTSADQLAIVSRGPDRSSSNTATANSGTGNPNVALSFNGKFPSDGTYSSGSGNSDNIGYPHFVDNTSLANYQSLGKLNINIQDYDDGISMNMPACPNNYNVAVVSVPRNANEAYVNYTSGGASMDLLQGLYLVKVFVGSAANPAWQEQVAIVPGTLTSRNITLSGVNSSLAGSVTINIFNASGGTLTIYQGGVSTAKGTVTSAAAPGTEGTFIVNACSRILVVNSSNLVIDSFIAPASIGSNHRYNSNSTCNITHANQTYNTVAIYDDGLLIGTVGRRGSQRAKTFPVRVNDVLTWKNESNTTINGKPNGGTGVSSYTVLCNGDNIQF